MNNILVSCLVNRSWNHSNLDWDGETVNGTLVDFSMQSAEDNSGKIIPIGIVMMDNNTFQSVPMEFITKR